MSQTVIFVVVKLPEEEVELDGEEGEAANVVTHRLKEGKNKGRRNSLFTRLLMDVLSGIPTADLANLETLLKSCKDSHPHPDPERLKRHPSSFSFCFPRRFEVVSSSRRRGHGFNFLRVDWQDGHKEKIKVKKRRRETRDGGRFGRRRTLIPSLCERRGGTSGGRLTFLTPLSFLKGD